MGFLLARLPLVCGIVFALAAFAFSCWQWWTFRYATFDLAFYVQALWLALRGEWQVSLLNVPLLGNHAEPIVFLALPFFAIWPHPMLLIALQTAALATMPSTAWRIARVLAIPPAGAVLLALAVVTTPATGFVALHEFHPEALAAPLLLLLIEARLKERRGLFWIWFLLALGCKENIALLLVAWCFIHVIVDWRRPRTWQIHWNILPLFVAAGWCALYAAFISPALNPGNVDYLELYSHLGKTTGEIAAGFFTNPQRILSAIHRALFGGNLVWALLLPFLALPILRPHWLLIAAPVLLQHLLSWRPSEWSIEAHYAAPLIPLFWIATAEAIARARLRTTIAALICLATLGAHAWIGPARVIARELARSSERVVERKWKAELLQAISPGASVTAGVPYLSHLATRDELHSLHHLLKGLKTLSRSTYQPPPATDAVVVDYADTATFSVHSGYYHPQMRTEDLRIVPSSDRLLHDFLAQKAWVERARNAFHIYLAGARDDLAVKADPTPVPIAQGSALTAVEVAPIGGVDSFQMRMQWQFEDARELFPWTMLILSDGERAYTILKGAAAVAFPAGEAREHWNVTLPATFPSGEYRLTLIFYNHMLAAWQGKLPPRDGSFIFRTIDLGTRQLTNGKLGVE